MDAIIQKINETADERPNTVMAVSAITGLIVAKMAFTTLAEWNLPPRPPALPMLGIFTTEHRVDATASVYACPIITHHLAMMVQVVRLLFNYV
jgi:hypothetical protein